ncbi:MAG: RraA family protein [Acidimicrobiia bacterium]|nr:RraA family protein [Acidimicrobiia bacterium]
MEDASTSPGIPAVVSQTDTPTICNALEVVIGSRTADGFTRSPVVPLDASLPPMVGYAVTATVVAHTAAVTPAVEVAALRRRYYEYVGNAARSRPTIVVIEDQSGPTGIGAFWGEVNVAVHKGFGVLGAITNGSMRDLDEVDPGFQILAGMVAPSHAFVHVTEIGVPVRVFGLTIRPGDLVHADRHGAVIIAPDHLARLPDAIRRVQESEAPILEAARRPDFSLEMFLETWDAK